jgi:hypothetical protein
MMEDWIKLLASHILQSPAPAEEVHRFKDAISIYARKEEVRKYINFALLQDLNKPVVKISALHREFRAAELLRVQGISAPCSLRLRFLFDESTIPPIPKRKRMTSSCFSLLNLYATRNDINYLLCTCTAGLLSRTHVCYCITSQDS